MSDLVGNPKDRFSCIGAHLILKIKINIQTLAIKAILLAAVNYEGKNKIVYLSIYLSFVIHILYSQSLTFNLLSALWCACEKVSLCH